MTLEPRILETLVSARDALDRASVPFHCTGGLVSSLYGEPRFTQDVDVVVRIRNSAMFEVLLLELAREHLVDVQFARTMYSERQFFQALNATTSMKVDFHARERIPGELDRSVSVEISPGFSIRAACPEDAVLSKLIWMQLGSEKSARDAAAMIARRPALDMSMMESLAAQLGITAQLAQALRLSTEMRGDT